MVFVGLDRVLSYTTLHATAPPALLDLVNNYIVVKPCSTISEELTTEQILVFTFKKFLGAV